MKIFRYIAPIFLFLLPFVLKGESIETYTGANIVEIHNLNVYSNCCSEYISEYQVENNLIKIIQTDISEDKCKCNCHFDFDYKIYGLESGTYTVEIYRQHLERCGYDKDTVFLAGTANFAIGNSRKIFSEIKYEFSQSNCKDVSEVDNSGYRLKEYKGIEVFPNPVSSSATIRFMINQKADVELIILNMLGKQIANIKQENLEPGYHSFVYDAAGLPSGIYIGKMLTSYGSSESFKMIWSK